MIKSKRDSFIGIFSISAHIGFVLLTLDLQILNISSEKSRGIIFASGYNAEIFCVREPVPQPRSSIDLG